MLKPELFITCEHASNQIPKPYQALFVGYEDLLLTHRGWDIGAFEVFKRLRSELGCVSQYAKWSRLLIEINRSLRGPKAFCEPVKSLPKDKKQQIINRYYKPYRAEIIETIEALIKQKQTVLHFAIHSFTPELSGIVRMADIGILYDPKRPYEKTLAQQLKAQLKKELPDLVVRFNYPYKGDSDGLTTDMRKRFLQNKYLGFEIEINQKHFLVTDRGNEIANALAKCLGSIDDNRLLL